MEEQEIEKYYHDNYKHYDRLGKNLKEALTEFLSNKEIIFHGISYRIKDLESLKEKISRKNYKNPIVEIEDFLGIRIICYYPSDLKIIEEVLNTEFNIKESIDKTNELGPDRFGYRSNHYIVTIKKEWCNAPNYRNLDKLKGEIQVRTILMHAWADIEHKLAYKRQEQVPEQFRRTLYQLSALLEVADLQFQNLKNQRDDLKETLVNSAEKTKHFNTDIELNLDTLQAYLDFTFPGRTRKLIYTRNLLEELITYDIKLKQLDNYHKKMGKQVQDFEKDLINGELGQTGIIRALLDVFDDQYWDYRKELMGSDTSWGKTIKEWKKKFEVN